MVQTLKPTVGESGGPLLYSDFVHMQIAASTNSEGKLKSLQVPRHELLNTLLTSKTRAFKRCTSSTMM